MQIAQRIFMVLHGYSRNRDKYGPKPTDRHVYLGEVGSAYSITLTAEDNKSDQITLRKILYLRWRGKIDSLVYCF